MKVTLFRAYGSGPMLYGVKVSKTTTMNTLKEV
jgi:hypothetical protein